MTINRQTIIVSEAVLAAEEALLNLRRLQAVRETARAEVLKEVQAQLDDIDAEFSEAIEMASAIAKEAELLARAAVLDAGQTLRGETLEIRFNRGKLAVDEEGLNLYAVRHPKVKAFMSYGEDYTSLNWRKSKDK